MRQLLIWDEPPAPTRNPGGPGPAPRRDERADRIVSALQRQPARWARIEVFASEAIANSRGQKYRDRGCQTARRKLDGRGFGLWARWPA